jgi:hypothetical protein
MVWRCVKSKMRNRGKTFMSVLMKLSRVGDWSPPLVWSISWVRQQAAATQGASQLAHSKRGSSECGSVLKACYRFGLAKLLRHSSMSRQ